MSRETYMDALMMAVRYGEYVTIGGGEPTIHPEFFDFLDKTIELYELGDIKMPPFMVTNGKIKGKALKLLDKYIDQERPVYVQLSQDDFHDHIDPEVVQRYRAHERLKKAERYSNHRRNDNGGAGINELHNILPVGRAKENDLGTVPIWAGSRVDCCCEDAIVDPEGVVWSCGCKHTKLGHISDHSVLDGYDHNYAHQGGFEPEEMREAT